MKIECNATNNFARTQLSIERAKDVFNYVSYISKCILKRCKCTKKLFN